MCIFVNALSGPPIPLPPGCGTAVDDGRRPLTLGSGMHPAGVRGPLPIPSPAGRGEQLGHGVVDAFGDEVEVGHDVPVGGEAEEQPVGVGRHCDGEPLVVDHLDIGVGPPHLAAADVERRPGAGDVGDHQVHRHGVADEVREPGRQPRELGGGAQHGLDALGEAGRLELDRLFVDLTQAGGGVGFADRELDHEERHPVSQHRAVLVVSAPGHRHHRLEPASGHVVAVVLEVAAQRSCAQGEDDVVHRGARRLADGPDVVEVDVGADPAPIPAYRDIPGRTGCRHEEVRYGGHDVAERTGHPLRAAQRLHRGLHDLGRAHHPLREAVEQQPARGGCGTWAVGGERWLLDRLAFQVADREEEIDVGDAVAQGVVALEDEAQLTVLEAVDEPHLPQRTVPVERLGLHAAEQLPHLRVDPRDGAPP